MTTSNQFLELDKLPPRIVFIGGGYISFEFAHIAARARAHVTILHRSSRPLARFDPDLVDQLVQRTRDLGIGVQLQADVKGIASTSSGLTVRASIDGEMRAFQADMVVHGAGRVPEIDDLDLTAAGVKNMTSAVWRSPNTCKAYRTQQSMQRVMPRRAEVHL